LASWSSSTGRPWQACCTPWTILSRVKGSVTPLRYFPAGSVVAAEARSSAAHRHVLAAAIALNVTLCVVAFKVLTARPVTIGQIRAGTVAAAVIWQALQLAGALLLGHKLKGATATYGPFALVLSLLAWIYLGAITVVICAEFNAVRAGQLWPRSLLAPFTDNAQLAPRTSVPTPPMPRPNDTRASRTSASASAAPAPRPAEPQS
jgi:hypothetical protein